MFVSDLRKSSFVAVPDKFLESLPEFCPYCEYPIEMSETLTGLHCSNPKCISKTVQRLVSLCNAIGVKNMGESRAEAFLKHFNQPSPLFIFEYDPKKHGKLAESISMDVSQQVYAEVQAKKSFTLSEYVKVAQLPDIQNSAVLLFNGYDSIADAYAPIVSGGQSYVAEKLSIKKADDNVSIRALKVLTSLLTFRTELEQYEPFVDIIKTQSGEIIELTAVCSDQVGEPFKTKADFYATVNNKHKNLHVTFLSAVNQNIDYLVWAGADGSQARYTNKVQKVEGYNKKYQDKVANGTATAKDKEIPIVTAMQFLMICDNLLNKSGIQVS